MSESTKIIVKYYEAFNQKNWQAFFDLLDEDVVHDVNQGGRNIGKATFRKFMDHMNHCYDEKLVDLVVMADSTDHRLAAEFMIEGTYLKTDPELPEARMQNYKIKVGAFFEVKNQKITRITNYYNMNEWLRQIN
jgi:steroid delta-isomerase-like uncharacterized protein